MRDELAERLLVRIMGWTSEDINKELRNLQALALYKYDQYQQFSPGMRFIESLAHWLAQFETEKERKLAYSFVKRQLIFVSHSEMSHLAAISFQDSIRPFLVSMIASQTGIAPWLVGKITNSPQFKLLMRQSLFLALSDGSRIDLFRRANPVDQEQVFRAHEFPQERANDMSSELRKTMEKMLGREVGKDEARFRAVFLLDDFSASGISYIRTDPLTGKDKGKVVKFHESLHAPGSIASIVDTTDLTVCLLLYAATEHAKEYLQARGTQLFDKVPFKVLVMQTIPDSLGESVKAEQSLLPLLSKYYDSQIESTSYKRGRHDRPYFGFDECGLPIILNHNTPNNSIPLLWFPEGYKVYGLFPRVSRFSD